MKKTIEEVKPVEEVIKPVAAPKRPMNKTEQAIYDSIEIRPMTIGELDEFSALISDEKTTVMQATKWYITNIYPELDIKKVSMSLGNKIIAETDALTKQEIEDEAKN